MYKSVLVASCFVFISITAFAMPRNLLPEESQIEFGVKEMGVPVSGKFKRFEATIEIDPVKPEKSSANMRIDIGSLTTENNEADVEQLAPPAFSTSIECAAGLFIQPIAHSFHLV